ncbi:MAG TPA: hypothetical protein VFZ65_18660 [Planctomycetota bacterium]|nr:hypothetical protein [Planctomycetota bacterium]
MIRPLAVLSLFLALATSPALRAQELSGEQFRADFSKALELGDEKLMDRATKRAPRHALSYYEELYWEKQKGDEPARIKTDALMASWARTFENGETMEKLQRWCDGMTPSTYDQMRKVKNDSGRLWQFYVDQVSKGLVKAEYEKLLGQFSELARNMESFGHSIEAADLWGNASVVGSKMPDKTLDDRRAVVDAIEQFLTFRKAWGYTFDEHYVRNTEYVKAEKLRIEEDAKKGEKRKAEGYDPNAKGVESLIMPDAKAVTHELKFETLTSWDADLDYGPKGGPVPAFWWLASLGKEPSSTRLSWFRRRELYMVRLGTTKFGMGFTADDPKSAVEIDASSKAKPSTFWLDAEKKLPYSMFFWTGTDHEMVGEAECNLAVTVDVGNVYFRSASSWKTAIGNEQLVLYDDNASGNPGDADPYEPPFKIATLGEHEGEGTVVPLLDSMRLGKGPRVPYSEFLHLQAGWFYMQKANGDEVGLRPLNPEYFKTGKVKLVWSGPKPSAPVQLVIQGLGDYKTAFFDVAGGKEVEVPAASFKVIYGRVMAGKGARLQTATLYQGTSEQFSVEPGKVFELKMGAPFTVQFERRGDENATIDALKILLQESSGCLLTEMHGMTLVPEVMWAKSEDGKGARAVAKFMHFTDPELVNKASGKHNNLGLLCACFPMPEGYRDGELVLKVKMPGEGLKMGLFVKKHPMFGDKLSSKWQ